MNTDQATALFREITIGLQVPCKIEYEGNGGNTLFIAGQHLHLVYDLLTRRGLRCFYIDGFGSRWR